MPSGKPRAVTCASAPRSASADDERLVALHVEDGVVAAELGACRDFGDAIGAAGVRRVGEDGFAAGCGALRRAISSLSVATTQRSATRSSRDALEHADDERDTGEESERLPGETRARPVGLG